MKNVLPVRWCLSPFAPANASGTSRRTRLFRLALLLLLLCLSPVGLRAATENDTVAPVEKVPVAVLSTNADSTKTLTFTYGIPDENLSAGSDGVYALNTGETGPGWNTRLSKQQIGGIGGIERTESAKTITQVVFEDAFAQARPTSTYCWFYGMSNLKNIKGISNLNTENVTDMSNMFYNCKSLTTLDLSSFNTENVKTMAEMFDYCRSLTSLDLSSFSTANVKVMEGMFMECSSLTTLDVSSFNTAKVTKMGSMFSGCWSLTSLDVSNFNTAKVTKMDYMFANCRSLTVLDVSNFNTEKVTDMRRMFQSCSAMEILNLGGNDFVKISSSDAAMVSVGTSSKPVTLVINSDFDKSVLGAMQTAATGSYYRWLDGYFSEPVVGETVVTDSLGYATYAPKAGMDFSKSADVRAFAARYDGNTQTIVLTEATGAPAHTPLLFIGNPGMHVLVAADQTPATVPGNELVVADEDVVADGSQWMLAEDGPASATAKSFRRLAQGRGQAGFARVATGTTIRAGEEYLVIDPTAVAGDYVAIQDVATGIGSARAAAGEDAAVYNLSGQRVGKGYKGLVVRNGRKVVVR